MNSSYYMQKMAISGLFITIWASMMRSPAYHTAWSQSEAKGETVEYRYEGQLAIWTTSIRSDVIQWQVELRDSRLGAWHVAIGFNPFCVYVLDWFPEKAPLNFQRWVAFDEEVFENMFSTLKRACGLYLKYNRLTVDRDINPLVVGLFDA